MKVKNIKTVFILLLIVLFVYIFFISVNFDKIEGNKDNNRTIQTSNFSTKLIGSSFVTMRMTTSPIPNEVVDLEGFRKGNAWHFDFTNQDDEFVVSSPSGHLTKLEIKDNFFVSTNLGTLSDIYSSDIDGYGVKDLMYLAEQNKLLITYTLLDQSKNCINLRLDEVSFNPQLTEITSQNNLFFTNPCLEIPVGGSQAGGRILQTIDGIYLTVGDFATIESLPQSNLTDYGKILFFPGNSFTNKVIYSSGHRNPQGITQLSSGEILSSEHGPAGGDEINLIRFGTDYGWPEVSLGFHYARSGFLDFENTHLGFEAPIYAFTPSIGIGAIAPVNLNEFGKIWSTDNIGIENLMIVGMRSRTLYRVELRGKDLRFAVVEPIDIDERIRDLKVNDQGVLWALTDDLKLLKIEKENILR
jgi:glucose/arabinose dehydrogenase